MAKAATACNAEGCERAGRTRGLCPACYYAATHGKGERGQRCRDAMSPARRPGPKPAIPAGSETSPTPPAPSAPSALKPGRATLAELRGQADRIEAEVNGTVADCRGALAAYDGAIASLRRRNAALLKTLVESRRQIQGLNNALKRDQH